MTSSRGLAVGVALCAGGFLLHLFALVTEPMQWLSPGVLVLALLFWSYLLWRLPDTPLHRSSLCAMTGGTMVGVAVQRHMLGGGWFILAMDVGTGVAYWLLWWSNLKILRMQATLEGAISVRPEIFTVGPEAIPPSQAIRYEDNPDNWVTGDGGSGGDASSQVVALDTDYSEYPSVYFGLDGEPVQSEPRRRREKTVEQQNPGVDAEIPARQLDRKPRSP